MDLVTNYCIRQTNVSYTSDHEKDIVEVCSDQVILLISMTEPSLVLK